MTGKLEDIYIPCDTCKIRIGPCYLAKKIYDFGPLKICKFCLREIYKMGKITVSTGPESLILTADGKIIEYNVTGEENYTVTDLGSNNIPYLDKGLTPISHKVHS